MNERLHPNPDPSPAVNAPDRSLTFERLVSETAARLAADGVRPETIREILRDAGVDECLRHVAGEPQGRLIVHHVWIVGEKPPIDGAAPARFTYSRALGSGLWAWVGANGTGKTTILNCIVWALTGADSGVSRRMRTWITDVVVQFSVGGNHYTTRIARRDEAISGGVYVGHHTADQIDLGAAEPALTFRGRDEMRELLDVFFMQQLGITSLRWTAHSSAKDDPDLHAHSTTWRTYAHAIHIEDDSYDDLIIDPQKGFGRQDRKILEMMLGVEYARAVAEIQVQADFALSAYARAKAKVGGRSSTLADQIRALEQEAADVQQALDIMQSGGTPVEDDSDLIRAREERAALLAEQNALIDEIALLETEIAGVEAEILAEEREKVAIQEQSEVEYLINSLPVVRCPHCESSVDDHTRLSRERHDKTCHVCMQPIQRARAAGDIKILLREHDEAISTLRKAIKARTERITAARATLAERRQASDALGKRLAESVRQAREGFTVSYANLLMRKGQLDGQIGQLRRGLAEVEDERNEVETSGRWHDVLQTAAEIADQIAYDHAANSFDELCHMAARLAAEFGLPDLEAVQIDEKRYVRLVQGGLTIAHTDLARSERVKFKVAFHLALMLIQVRNGVGKHPAFAIIDTPGTAEINTSDLIAMVRDLTRINTLYGEKIQLLVATARPETIPHLPPESVAVAGENGRFF